MIDPKNVCLFQPSELKAFKAGFFTRIGQKIQAKGGKVCMGDAGQLKMLPKDIVPVVGCSTYLKDVIGEWRDKKRPFIYLARVTDRQLV